MSPRTHPLRRLSRAVAVVGLLAWGVGSALSMIADVPHLFQRFGALGVAAAVLFFNDRLTQIELSRQRSVERLLHEFGVELEVMKSGTAPTEIPPQGYVVDFLTEERAFDRLRSHADRLGMFNLALLTVSTLQWGFGDMFLRAVLPAGGPA